MTYSDLQELPDDGLRHEIIDGEHLVQASSGIRHQLVSIRLTARLQASVASRDLGVVLAAPTDVYLGPRHVVVPDILVVLSENRRLLGEAKVEGAPNLIVEILSASTAAVDRGRKLTLYARGGVREYWIVDPEAQVVEQHVLEGERYRLVGRHSTSVTLAILPDVTIDLTQVW
jgi:Uma2 family endonuclease